MSVARQRVLLCCAAMLTRRYGTILAGAAALVALAPATAVAAPGSATMFVHSAKSGKIEDGKLTLRGVGRHVTWAASDGERSARVRIPTMHRALFARLAPPVTGTLHVAGHRGGEEPTFRLSRPRFNASRGTVSYRVRRVRKRTHARAAGLAKPRSFGAASLSVLSDDRDCLTMMENNTGHPLQLARAEVNGTWTTSPGTPGQTVLAPGHGTTWEAAGDGCGHTVDWQTTDVPGGALITISTAFDTGTPAPPYSCEASAGFGCTELSQNLVGFVNWGVHTQ
jgi:hypothetical protein